MGVSHDAGEKIGRESCDLNSSKDISGDLRRIDRLVVMANFLRKD